MIVSNQSTAEVQQNRESKKEVQKSSDRFARLLDGHAQQQRATDELARRVEKQQMQKTQEAASVQPGASANIADNPSDSPHASVEGIAEAPSVHTPAQIHKLAEELGQHIDLHLSSGSTHAVDITFHSRSLAGLQVQIRQGKGELSIHFLSQSTITAKLLSLHASSLKESLEDRGLRIQSIVIANGHSRSAFPGRRDAEA
jgi:hypothetical protein